MIQNKSIEFHLAWHLKSSHEVEEGSNHRFDFDYEYGMDVNNDNAPTVSGVPYPWLS